MLSSCLMGGLHKQALQPVGTKNLHLGPSLPLIGSPLVDSLPSPLPGKGAGCQVTDSSEKVTSLGEQTPILRNS